jgi:zinc D-Ala-D-Ala carboxypeptidase
VRKSQSARRVRVRKARVAGLRAGLAAIAALSHDWRASSSSSSSSTDPSSSTPAPQNHVPRRERRPLRETGGAGSTNRLGLGQADGAIPDGTTVFDDEVPGVAKLDSDLLAAVRRAATDAGIEFYVDSGWRSPEYQERLLREAISKYGSAAEATRWVATPNTSAHVKGEAVDIGPAASAAWLSEHGAAYGLCQIYANEPWHFELRPDAAEHGCPAMYADPTHDPRMQQTPTRSET